MYYILDRGNVRHSCSKADHLASCKATVLPAQREHPPEVVWVLCRLFDLKSHNVLLTRDGTGKIADVGLAKVLTQVGNMSCLV